MLQYITYKKQAKKNWDRLDSLQLRSVPIAKRVATRLRKKANKAFKERTRFVLEQSDRDYIDSAVSDVAALSVVESLKSLPKKVVSPSLALSFRKEVREASKVFGFNVEQIRQHLDVTNVPFTDRTLEIIVQGINDSINTAREESLTVRQSLRILSERLAALGIGVEDPHRIETLIRTTSSMSYNAGLWAATQDDDNIWGYVYLTMRDERVRLEHAKLEGYTRIKTDPIWNLIWPPNGYNCRCSVVPITNEQRKREKVRSSIKLDEEEVLIEIEDAFQFNSGESFLNLR